MKKFLIVLLGLISLSTGAQTTNHLKLRYHQPAAKWTDALPLGNGRIGAMVFGGVEKDRIQFNEETLWTGGPRDYNRKGAYQYLNEIRKLLFDGKQAEAEGLAEQQFMGTQSEGGDKVKWLAEMRALKGMTGNPALPGFDDSQWQTIRVPAYEGWETIEGMEGLDGAVWFRTTFEVKDAWMGKNLVLDLNRVRDQGFTYINGQLAGVTEAAGPGKIMIPKNLVVKGTNTIAVQVINYYDGGGIAGYKDTSRHIGIYPEGSTAEKEVSLSKTWKYKIQNDEPPAVPRYQADYQPFGDLFLNFKGGLPASGYQRELDLTNAISKTSYLAGGVRFTRDYFVSQPNQALTVHLTANKTGSISFDAVLNSPHKYSSVRKIDDSTIALSLKVRNGVLRGESYLRVQAAGGTVVIDSNRIIVSNADEVTLYLTAGTNYKNYTDVSADPVAVCTSALERLNGKAYGEVKAAHIKEYRQYFNTFSIDFGHSENEVLPTKERLEKFAASGDASLVALYAQYGRYLLISSSRPGTGAANLQGIWNDLLTPPWGSKYTTNINAEMNYWPAELLNLSALHQPLFAMMEELSKAGAETAREYYNAPGWVVHHNTDVWRGTAPINASNHGIWVSGAGWLSHHLWEHYLFTQDRSFLKNNAYPIMREAARFFNSFLVKDQTTGWLISTPSNSPEQGGLVAGPTMDHEIIRSLFRAVIEAGAILQTDKSLGDSLQQKLQQMAPYQVGRYGQLQEWLQDVDDTANKHRHVSHLWAVYPGREITWADSALMKAARQSLLYRGDAATGWSLAWKINFWARFKDGDHAFRLIKMLLSPAEKGGAGSYTNLFDAHPPFQIDGNFGGAAGIGELLVQSHQGYIDLLPALPSALAAGEVKGICARGGFQLNMKWREGKLGSVDVISLAGNTCLLQYKEKKLSFKTIKGQTYKLNGQLQRL